MSLVSDGARSEGRTNLPQKLTPFHTPGTSQSRDLHSGSENVALPLPPQWHTLHLHPRHARTPQSLQDSPSLCH